MVIFDDPKIFFPIKYQSAMNKHEKGKQNLLNLDVPIIHKFTNQIQQLDFFFFFYKKDNTTSRLI